MNGENINDFIKKIFNSYDKQNNKYNKYLTDNVILDDKNNMFIDKNTNETIDKITNNEILGILYHDKNVFVWYWALPDVNFENCYLSKVLLYYGLRLTSSTNTNEHAFIRSILVNSRIYVGNDFELEFIQALVSYLLKELNTNFIFKTHYYDKEDKKKIIQTVFYLIKI